MLYRGRGSSRFMPLLIPTDTFGAFTDALIQVIRREGSFALIFLDPVLLKHFERIDSEFEGNLIKK